MIVDATTKKANLRIIAPLAPSTCIISPGIEQRKQGGGRTVLPLFAIWALVADTEILETVCENKDTPQHMKGVGGFRLTPDVLAKYAGTYQFGSGREAVITVDGPTLILKLSGQRSRSVAS